MANYVLKELPGLSVLFSMQNAQKFRADNRPKL